MNSDPRVRIVSAVTVRRSPSPRRSGAALLTLLVGVGLPGCGTADPAAQWGTPSGVASAAASRSSANAESTSAVSLAFAGDVHFSERTAKLLTGDPATAFGPISQVLSAADLSMVNLETAVTTRGTPEPKEYHFRTPPTAFAAVRGAGVDAVAVANNHALDYGQVGLADTLDAAKSAGVPAIGAGRNTTEAYAPWITEVKGVRVAILAISQVHELESTWIAKDTRAGLAMAGDGVRAAAAVRAAKKLADIVVVYVHWGHEGSGCPAAEQKTLAKTLASAGADVLVGTHAHLLLGDGWLGNTYVSYGLGNFVWWWDDAFSNDTGVVRVIIRNKMVVGTEFVPAVISRTTGQPLPVSGAEETRVRGAYDKLRACTGLAASRTVSGSP